MTTGTKWLLAWVVATLMAWHFAPLIDELGKEARKRLEVPAKEKVCPPEEQAPRKRVHV